MSKRLLVVAGLAVAVAWLVWTLRSTPARPLAEQGRSERAASSGAQASELAQPDESADARAPERVAVTAPATEAPAAETPAADARLRGRVLDAARAPIAGASVVATYAIDEGFDVLDLALPPPAVAARATTDEQGEFALEVGADRSFQLAAEAPSFTAARATGCKAGDYVELVLRRPAALYGRITRRDDGLPAVGARVGCRPTRKSGGETPRAARVFATSAADGRYHLEGLTPGDVVLEIEPLVEAAPQDVTFQLAPGEAREQNVVLELGATIGGHVTDAATGLPIEGAQVGHGWTMERYVVTDVDGAYTIQGFSPRSATLNVRAHGYGQLEHLVCDLRTQVVDEVADFALTPQLIARGRVVDAQGEPLSDVYVAAVASEIGHGMFDQRIDWRAGRTDERGAFELTELRRDAPHSLFARRPGFGVVVYDFPDLASDAATIELGDLVLPQASIVAGTVVDALEQPVPGSTVTLLGANADRGRLRAQARTDTWMLDLYVAQRNARCDAHGRFAFADVAPGKYVLQVALDENHGTAAKREVVVEPGASVRDVVLTVDVGLAIEGRVVVADGGALPTVYVSVDPDGEGGNADCEVERDGRFSARGLSVGRYTLSAYPYASDAQRAAGRLFLSTVLHGIASGSREVVIELRAARRVHGRVVDSTGSPVESVAIGAFDAHGEQVDNAVSGPDGAFEIDVAVDEACELRAFAHDGDEDPSARAPASGEIELRLPPS